MNKTIDFQWELTEENFRRMYTDTDETDVFGSVRFGEYLVEFRMTNAGLVDDPHEPTTDVYHYGEEGDEGYFLLDGTPYHLLDEEFTVPHRRSLAGFMQAIENEVLERIATRTWCGFKSEIIEGCAAKPTLSHETWNPQRETTPAKDDSVLATIPTMIGNIVVENKKDCVYPGIWILLEREGRLYEAAMVEVDQDIDFNEVPLLKCHVYDTDQKHDEPIFDYTTDGAQIDNYLASLA